MSEQTVNLTVDARKLFIVTLVDQNKRIVNIPAYVASMKEAVAKAEEYAQEFKDTEEGKLPENKDMQLTVQSVVHGGRILL